MLINKAALRLLRTQKTDGGWQWNNPDTDPSSGLPTPANTIGVTALGVLDEYRRSNNNVRIGNYTDLMAVCGKAYDKMVANSTDPDPSKNRIRGPDIRFLVRLSEYVVDPQYLNFAKTRWLSAKTEFGAGTATGFAEYIRDVRKGQNLPAAISWDINLYIVSLAALHKSEPAGGFDAEVAELAEVIYNSLYVPPKDFNMANKNQAEYWIGVGGALDAFAIAGVHLDRVQPLYDAMIAGQQPDGRWIGVSGGSDIQTTAYNAVALAKAYWLTYPGRTPEVVHDALNYLQSQQLPQGGFEYSPGVENTEVTSEVIQATFRLTR